MTVTLTETIQTPGADAAAHGRRVAPTGAGVEAALSSVGTAASDAVSATVAFSGQALHALEHAGEVAVEGVEDLAVGAWHAVEAAAGAVEDGASAVCSGSKTVARQLGHYAEVGLSATGQAVSEIASGAVMAASAGGKALLSIL